MTDIVVVEARKQTRRLFIREFKLGAVEQYYNNEKKIQQVINKSKVIRKQIRNWIAEENIRKQKNKSKIVRGRKAHYSLLEEELLRQFREQRNLGEIMKRWWFLSKAKKSCWKNIEL